MSSTSAFDQLSSHVASLQETDEQIDAEYDRLLDLEKRARRTFVDEDAQELSAVWEERKGRLAHLAELRRRRGQHWVELQTAFESAVLAIQAEADQLIAETRAEYEALRTELSHILRRGEQLMNLAGSDAELEADPGRPSRTSELLQRIAAVASRGSAPDGNAGRLEAWNGAAGERAAGARNWKIYDVDSGTMVHTLEELDAVLRRWWPRVPDRAERIERFLVMPEAEAMPAGLRRELSAAGYYLAPRVRA
jgi:hypothetical protein